MPRLDFPAGQRTGRTQAINDDDPAQLAHRLLHAPDITIRDRVAALLIVLFAQPVARIARVTIDDVTINADAVTIRLGTTAIDLPEPLAGNLRDLVTTRRSGAAAAIDEPRWLFQGKAPGRPIGEFALSRRLKLIGVDCAAARRSTLLHPAAPRQRDPRRDRRRNAWNPHPHCHQPGRDRRPTLGRLSVAARAA